MTGAEEQTSLRMFAQPHCKILSRISHYQRYDMRILTVVGRLSRLSVFETAEYGRGIRWLSQSRGNSLGRNPPHKFRTLDPEKLQPEDYLDFAGRRGVYFQKNPLVSCKLTQNIARVLIYCGRRQYPPNAQGYLYYHRAQVDTMGELRFRICDPPNTEIRPVAEDFIYGNDLNYPTGLPWAIPLYRMIHFPNKYDGLVQLLLQDGLINESIIDRCHRIVPPDSIAKVSYSNVTNNSVVYSLGQVFPIVASGNHTFHVYQGDDQPVRRMEFHFKPPMSLSEAPKGSVYHSTINVHDGVLVLEIFGRYHAGTYIPISDFTYALPRQRMFKHLIPPGERIVLPAIEKYIRRKLCSVRFISHFNKRRRPLRTIDSVNPRQYRRSLPSQMTSRRYSPQATSKHPISPSSELLDISGSIGRLRDGTNIPYSSPSSQVAFPPDTRGCIYWYTEPDLPSMAGEFRFRLASNGVDLLNDNGLPWKITLITVVNYHPALTAVLYRAGIITRQVISRLHAIVYNRYSTTPLIWKIGQIFPWKSGNRFSRIYLVDEDGDWISVEVELSDYSLTDGGSGYMHVSFQSVLGQKKLFVHSIDGSSKVKAGDVLIVYMRSKSHTPLEHWYMQLHKIK